MLQTREGRTERSKFHQGLTNEDAKSILDGCSTQKKIRQGIASSKTAINKLGDPLPKMDTIHAWLGELYDQVCKQTITAGVPTRWNCEQQEKEIIQHFKEM